MNLRVAVAAGVLGLGCSSESSGGGGPSGEPMDPALSGKHGLEAITLSYGFVRNVESESSFLEHDIAQSGYVLGAVLSSVPVNCGSNMDAVVDSQQGLFLGFLFGELVSGKATSSELILKYRGNGRSRGLSTSGSTVFATLGPPTGGKYPASINAVYDSNDPDDVVSFVGDTSLADCAAQ